MSDIYSFPSQEIFINKNLKENTFDFPLLIDYQNSLERNIKSLDKNNLLQVSKCINTNDEINRNKISKDNNTENIFKVPEKCRRCRTNPPEIMCKDCYPFIYFCINCSNNLHSIESKKSHNIISLKELNQEIFNDLNFNNNNYLSGLDFSSSSTSPYAIKYNTNYSKYISDMNSLYETEKNNLIKKSLSLEKNLENIKQESNEKINELQDKLNKIQNSKDLEIKILEEKKNYELKNILQEKQNTIDILSKRNEEINKFNEDLIRQLSEYKEILNKLKIKNINIIQRQKDEIEKLNNEKNDLIKYYEKKINSMNNTYNEEKNNIIKEYENQIKKINLDYNNNKEKMKSILFQREKDIEEMINNHRDAINEKNKETNDYMNKNNLKNKEYNDLVNIIKEKYNEIKKLKILLNEENKKYINEYNDKMVLEQKCEELTSVIEDIKGKNIYLNRLTHGKFNK